MKTVAFEELGPQELGVPDFKIKKNGTKLQTIEEREGRWREEVKTLGTYRPIDFIAWW